METYIKTFDELSNKELYEIIRARENVFIVEQDCPYHDADGLDEDSVHIFYADDDGKVLAYLRVLHREGDPGTVQIGRVITISRGTGLGRKILHEAVEYAINVMGAESLYLEAQTYAAGFYAKEGFRINSEEFFEDGMLSACRQLYQYAREDVPVTVYYAYKQSDTDESGKSSASS